MNRQQKSCIGFVISSVLFLILLSMLSGCATAYVIPPDKEIELVLSPVAASEFARAAKEIESFSDYTFTIVERTEPSKGRRCTFLGFAHIEKLAVTYMEECVIAFSPKITTEIGRFNAARHELFHAIRGHYHNYSLEPESIMQPTFNENDINTKNYIFTERDKQELM